MKRRANKVDANHGEIRDALRAAGANVVDCSHIGGGFPDLLVSFRSQIFMVEVKDGAKSPSQRKLTADQVEFHKNQRTHGVHVHVVYDVDDALSVIGARRVA